MKFIIATLLALASIAASALEITVNYTDGASSTFDASSIRITNGKAVISGAVPDGGSSSSSSSSSSGVTCGAWPSGVDRYPDWDLSNPGSQVELPVGQRTLSFGFEALPGADEFGTLNFSSAPTWTSINRDVWISDCPESSPSDPICSTGGANAFSIKWTHQTRRGYGCMLGPGKQYYINVKNEDCPGVNKCGVNRNLYR